MKKTELKRFTPLTARTALRRTGTPRTAKRHNTPRPRNLSSGIPAKVRAALAARSGGMCEIAANGCTGRAVDPSHRKKTGAGGRHGDAAVRHHVLSNLLHACRFCHREHVHAFPAAAYWRGWMLHENEDPAAVPVFYRGAWALLADDGSVTPTTTPKEATR